MMLRRTTTAAGGRRWFLHRSCPWRGLAFRGHLPSPHLPSERQWRRCQRCSL
jgi:hypothetical protein